ncbi:MAG: hypothetical protein DMD42_00735 [Gemmatimonadetes bacterium]|nr:MAG: hypothetical protein DMD42_00735 [Gemmatimonadota bacterium]
MAGSERVRIGQIDERQRATAGVARPRPRDRALQQLHQHVRPRIREQCRQAESRLSERHQREPDRERGARAAEMRHPAHHAGTGVGGMGRDT